MKTHRDYKRLNGFLLAGAVAGASMLLATTAGAAAKVVNCIGEQTTTTAEGSTAAQNWPEVLGGLLGAGYTVNNDGVNTGTVISGSAKSATSLEGSPSIIIIGPFAEHDYAANITETAWQTAYENLVDAYLALASAPTVYVMTPPPAAFVYQSTAEQTFATTIVQTAVLAVAQLKNLHVIRLDQDAVLGMASSQATPPDGHFNVAGMAEVAKLAYDALTGTGGTGGSGASSGGSGMSSGMSGASSGMSGSSGTAAGTGTTPTSGTVAGTGTTPTSGTVAGTGTAPTSGTMAAGTGMTTATSGTVAPSGSTGGTSGEPAATSGGGGTGSNSATSGTGGGTTQGTQQSTSGCTMGAAGSSRTAAGLLSLMGLAFIVARKRSARRT